jgi:DNA-binding winged helix-turn-helix (wHTH) protein/tetratricopeptide (TPR) repeat protein
MDRASTSNIFRFGLFEADVAQATLRRNGSRIKIQDQPFRVLIILLERPGEIVSREELRQKLWPEGTFVDFDGSLNVILKKLRTAIDDDSDNPRFIETVPRRGYRFIAPVACSSEAKVSASDGGPSALPAMPIPLAPGYSGSAKPLPTSARTSCEESRQSSLESESHRAQSRILIVVFSGIFLLAALSAAWFLWPRKAGDRHGLSSNVTSVPVRRSVAVLGFHSLSGKADDAWLAPALGEMLSTELAGGERLRLVSGEEVAHLRLTSPWSQTDTLDRGSTSRIGTALNSDLLLLGSYTSIGGQRGHLRVDVRLQDAQTGEILAEIREIGGAQDLFDIVSRVGEKLRDRIGVPPLESSDHAGILAALPLDREAAKFYALGIAKLRTFDALAAKDLLEQTTKADPKFSLGHAMLARAWAQLGYEQRRRDEAKRSLDLSADLPRAQRMIVEGEYYESLGDQERAAANYHVLFELFPDNIDYGLQLAVEQNLAGHATQTLETIRRLRGLPLPSSGDPRIDLVAARAVISDKPTSLSLVRSAIAKSEAQGNKLIYARARKDECMLLLYGEHPDQAKPACEDARNIFLAAGNHLDAADALRFIADGMGTAGHYEEAIATYQQALIVLEGMGEHQKTGSILNNMAINYANEGKLDRAEQLYRQAKFHFEQANNRQNISTALGNIADILYLKGDLAGAEKSYRQTLDFIATIDHGEPGYPLYRLADLKLAQGNVKDAHRLAQQAIDSMPPSLGAYQYRTSAMIVLGEVLQAEGDLQGARRLYEETRETRQKMGANDLSAESQVAIANLLLEQDRPLDAEPLFRSAIAEFESENGAPDASGAYALLSRTLLMENKIEDATKALERAVEFARSNPDPSLRLTIDIQRGRIESSQQTPRRARQTLQSAIAETKKFGFHSLGCEARLALSKLELQTNPPLGKLHLSELASDARSHGLELTAKDAERAARAKTAVAPTKTDR